MSQPDGQWFKSSFSGSSGCVEIKFDRDRVHVRDAQDPLGPTLIFTHHEWDAFLRGAENHEFSPPG
jgi:hypothetical protein